MRPRITDANWSILAPILAPSGRRGAPPAHDRRRMAEACLYLARTGAQLRELPARFPPWTAVYAQLRRWEASGAWTLALREIHAEMRMLRGRSTRPSTILVDSLITKGARSGKTFHRPAGQLRLSGSKRTVLTDELGYAVAVSVDPASLPDDQAAAPLLAAVLASSPTVRRVVADQGYPALAAICESAGVVLDIMIPPPQPPPVLGPRGGQPRKKAPYAFTPLVPLFAVEHAHARIGRYRRMARCYEGAVAAATAWLQVAAIGAVLSAIG